MSLGMAMGITQDFSLTPVHAHINLLGWVSMMLYGLYYRAAPRPRRLGWMQAGIAFVGMATMTIGLAALLTGVGEHGPGEAATIAGSLLVISSLGLFVAILAADLRIIARAAS